MGRRVGEALLGFGQGEQRGDSATPIMTQHH